MCFTLRFRLGEYMKLLNTKEVQSLLLDLMKEVHEFMIKHELKYYLLGGSALGAIRHKGFIPWDDDIDIGMFRDDYEKFLLYSKDFCNNYEIENLRKNKYCDYGLTRIYIKNTYINNPTINKTKLDKRLYFDIFPLDNVPNNKEQRDIYEKRISKAKKKIALLDVKNYNNSSIVLFAKKIVSLLLSPFRRIILLSFDKLLTKYRNTNTKYICSLCSQYSFEKQVMLKTTYGTPKLHKFEDSEFFVPNDTNLYLTTLFGKNYMDIPPVEKRRKGFDIYKINEDK